VHEHWNNPEDKEYTRNLGTGDGIELVKPTITSVTENDIALNGFRLYQNYPNPFNPSTVIGYQLPVNSQVTLKVYDVLGREVATLVNEVKPAGEYEVKFDATDLASRVYIYKIHAGSFVQGKKMILLK
jgi:hypothetical protein